MPLQKTSPHKHFSRPTADTSCDNRSISEGTSIVDESSHPSRELFTLLPSGRGYRSNRATSSRLRNSFFPEAVRLLSTLLPPNAHPGNWPSDTTAHRHLPSRITHFMEGCSYYCYRRSIHIAAPLPNSLQFTAHPLYLSSCTMTIHPNVNNP